MEELIKYKEPVDSVKSPRELFLKIKKINIDYRQEHLIVFFMSYDFRIIDCEIIIKGGACHVDECLKTTFRKALEKDTAGIILCHNHPQGAGDNIIHSKTDKESFIRAGYIGDFLGIEVYGSIVFNSKKFHLMTIKNKKIVLSCGKSKIKKKSLKVLKGGLKK